MIKGKRIVSLRDRSSFVADDDDIGGSIVSLFSSNNRVRIKPSSGVMHDPGEVAVAATASDDADDVIVWL